MSADHGLRSGGQVLVDQLRIHGVDTIFCVPGESYLTVIDSLHDAQNEIKTVACRQEGGATNMAEAYGKLTGRPGVAMVTRGPGACNGSIGAHTAMLKKARRTGQIRRRIRCRFPFKMRRVDIAAFPFARYISFSI